MARWTRPAVVFVFLFILAGCAKKPPAPTPAALPQPPAPSAAEGKTSYKFVFDPSNPVLGLPEDIQFHRPAPRDVRALPVYPPDALAAGDGPHRELVRIVIDKQGRVAEVGDSPLGVSDGGPHAAGFRAAVDAAVRAWVFAPGALVKVEPGHDLDGDGKPDYKVATSIDPVPVYYDVRFLFEIVDGRGIVTKQ